MEKKRGPRHIGMILDGNRTWATGKGLPKMVGHTKGAINIKRNIIAAIEHGVEFVTMYILSTENLKNRSESELNHLFSLFSKIIEYTDLFDKYNVKLRIIGDMSKLPESVQASFKKVMERTKDYQGLTLTLAANYGGRDEITRAVKKILEAKVSPDKLTEELVDSYLDTAGLPDVDMIIRTSGHKRLSNFLPWQGVYAELYFTETKWPAFSPKELEKAIEWYFQQEKHLGK